MPKKDDEKKWGRPSEVREWETSVENAMNKKGYQKLVIRTQKQKKDSKEIFLSSSSSSKNNLFISDFSSSQLAKAKKKKRIWKVFKTFSFSSFSLLTEGLQEEEDLDPISYHWNETQTDYRTEINLKDFMWVVFA